MTEKILQAIKELREKTKKRNFPQSFDLIIKLKEFDAKKPENKLNEEIVLPNGTGSDAEVVVFSDDIKDARLKILTTNDISRMNKKEGKKLVRNTDFFLAEPKLMPTIAKTLGAYLGPVGKMPKLISDDVKSTAENYKISVRARIKDSPVIQCPVGKEDMKDEKIVENIGAVLRHLESKLPRGKNNVGRVMLKLTMSKPVNVEV